MGQDGPNGPNGPCRPCRVGSEKDDGVKGDELEEARTGTAPMLGGVPTVSERCPSHVSAACGRWLCNGGSCSLVAFTGGTEVHKPRRPAFVPVSCTDNPPLVPVPAAIPSPAPPEPSGALCTIEPLQGTSGLFFFSLSPSLTR